MKKETRTYFKNVVRTTGFAIDVINMILGVAIIVFAVIALSGGEDRMDLFPLVFVLGAILSGLNAYKIMRQNKLFGVFFAAFGILLLIACVFSFVVLSGLIIL